MTAKDELDADLQRSRAVVVRCRLCGDQLAEVFGPRGPLAFIQRSVGPTAEAGGKRVRGRHTMKRAEPVDERFPQAVPELVSVWCSRDKDRALRRQDIEAKFASWERDGKTRTIRV